MNGHRDPVDSALDLLRSESWTAGPFSNETEQKLMNQMQQKHSHGRIGKSPVAVAAVGLLALGGVAFATTGAGQKFKQWVLHLTVDGQPAEILVEPGKPASMVFKGDDGSLVELNVQADELSDGQRTQVMVRKSDANRIEENEIVSEAVRWNMQEAPGLEVLDGAEQVASWSDDNGRLVELFVRSNEASAVEGTYIVVEGFQPDAARRILPTPLINHIDPATSEITISVDDHDMVEVQIANGAENVAKIRLVTDGGAGQIPDMPGGRIKIDRENGQIHVNVDALADGDDN